MDVAPFVGGAVVAAVQDELAVLYVSQDEAADQTPDVTADLYSPFTCPKAESDGQTRSIPGRILPKRPFIVNMCIGYLLFLVTGSTTM